MARPATDEPPSQDTYLNLNSVEETYESAFSQRLGSIINNANGTLGQPVFPLSAKVITVTKLGGLAGNAWRYAGTSDGKLWRIAGLAQGAYTQISSTMSGNPFWALSWCNSDFTANPYLFIADSGGMLKDNGTLAAPQQMGIWPPQFPVAAQSQEPTTEVVLDNYTSPASGYSYSGISGGSNASYVSTTLSSTVSTPGIQAVTVADVTQPGLFQLLSIGSGASAEIVLVLLVTPTGFIADFTKAHASGSTVTSASLSVTVPSSTTATVSKSFGGTPIPSSETLYGNEADYIGMYLYVSDPSQVQSVTLKLDCGDGSFESDYFYKVIAQGPLQNLVSLANTANTDPTTAFTEALLSDSLDLYGNQAGAIGELNTGLDNWTPLLFQLSDFAGAGRADFADPVFNWANVNGYQIQIVTNDNTSVTIQLSALLLFGGAGPDTLGGVAYDYVFTLFNSVDGTESNPSQIMTNQNPPNQTNWVYPRRQPVLLTMNLNMFQQIGGFTKQDSQADNIRIYRRGGTLGDNFRRLDQVPVNNTAGGTVTYLDTTPDYLLASADFVSFTNNIPIPSLLTVPVNTTLTSAIANPGWQVVIPVSMTGISIGQLVTLGTPTAIANNFETVVVTAIVVNPVTHRPSAFYAYVQNFHASGEQVQASYKQGQPVYGMVYAFNQFWYWGDPNNPSTLGFSTPNGPQYVSEANNVIISTPDDYITAVAAFKGNLYVSTIKGGWWWVTPGTSNNPSPQVYPTTCKHGCMGPFGFVVTEEGVYYQAIDGIRFFAGGGSEYLTQGVEFLFQGIGTSPIVEADQTKLSQTVMAYWNNMIFVSYIGADGNRHRLIIHTVYKRMRNDDVDAQCLNLEADTNDLLYGDSNGLVHIDRQNLPYDQANVGGLLQPGAININLQTAQNFQNEPANQKNYNNLTLDVNTQGQTLNVFLIFNDGQLALNLGTISNTQRGKINIPINSGLGQQAYKVSLQITGSLTQFAYIYQAAIEALVLPKTRRTFDSYDLNLGGADSKFARDIFIQYSAGAAITVNVYYDDSPIPGFTFTMPQAGGIRNPLRQRLPAVSFRTIRFVGTSTADFLFWQDSAIYWKSQGVGRGYEKAMFVEN